MEAISFSNAYMLCAHNTTHKFTQIHKIYVLISKIYDFNTFCQHLDSLTNWWSRGMAFTMALNEYFVVMKKMACIQFMVVYFLQFRHSSTDFEHLRNTLCIFGELTQMKIESNIFEFWEYLERAWYRRQLWMLIALLHEEKRQRKRDKGRMKLYCTWYIQI